MRSWRTGRRELRSRGREVAEGPRGRRRRPRGGEGEQRADERGGGAQHAAWLPLPPHERRARRALPLQGGGGPAAAVPLIAELALYKFNPWGLPGHRSPFQSIKVRLKMFEFVLHFIM
ncbi:hypothetical protein ACQJBY_040363 [Aegilops geniculata]